MTTNDYVDFKYFEHAGLEKESKVAYVPAASLVP
jgi:hypothetical protein